MTGLRRHLTYANVTATLALVLAAGTGVVYAAGEIGSREIANNSVRTQDLKDRRGVTGSDVKRNSLGGDQIDEKSLVGSRIVGLQGQQAGNCDPQNATFGDCASVSVDLSSSSELFVVTTGGFESAGATPAKAECEIRIDNVDANLSDTPGEISINTSSVATDGFARTLVTDPLPAGTHNVALACQQLGTDDARIRTPTIAVLAVTTP